MITLDQQLAELKRELAMRKQVYPNLINQGKLKRSDANNQYMALQAAAKTISRIIAQRDGEQTELELTNS